MYHNNLKRSQWLLSILVICVMTPSLLAFNFCRRGIRIAHCRSMVRCQRAVPSLPRIGYKISICHFSSQTNTQETQSKSPDVRSIRPLITAGKQLQLLSFYRFVPITDPESIRDALFERLKKISGLRGTVYVAKEGINAQFAVPEDSLHELLSTFGKSGETEGACLPFDVFEKEAANMGKVVDETVPTFDKLIVRTRDHILRDGISFSSDVNSILDWEDAGVELDAKDWDTQLRSLLSSSTDEHDKIQLLDCRNTYESDQGTFLESTPLNTQTFSETWSVLDSQVQSNTLDPSKPVYIFCTGGIRCVKVGAYLKQRLGFEDVRSLKHGIIGYERWHNAEVGFGIDNNNYPESSKSLWIGDNFLFDKRRFANEDDSGSAQG
jgi:predicted sulfurtransferase